MSARGVPVARSESCTAASSIAKHLSRSGFAGATAFHGVPFTVEDSLDVAGEGHRTRLRALPERCTRCPWDASGPQAGPGRGEPAASAAGTSLPRLT